MNQNILQYYILGGTIWRKRRKAIAAANAKAEKEEKQKGESVHDLLRAAMLAKDANAPVEGKRSILQECKANSNKTSL